MILTRTCESYPMRLTFNLNIQEFQFILKK